MMKNQLLSVGLMGLLSSRKMVTGGAVLCFTVLISLTQFSVQAAPGNSQQGSPLKAVVPLMKVTADRSVAGFSVLSSTTEPIVKYYRHISMLENQDIEPMLQVFADGQVRVHVPVYMKNAGNYEYTLTPAELVVLVRSLSTQGIMDFDKVSANNKKRAHDVSMKNKGELHYVTDSLETVVDIRLQNYQKTSRSKMQTNFTKRFSWKNLEQDARYYKGNSAIQSAADGIKELDKLINHPSMKRVK